MASKQIKQNECIAVAEAMGMAIETMAITNMERQENAGIKISGSILKQTTFSWRAEDNYEELHNFKLEVSNMLQSCNLGQT